MINNSKRWWKRTSISNDTAKIPHNARPTTNDTNTSTNATRLENNPTDNVPVILLKNDGSFNRNNDNFSTRALKGSTLTEDNEADTEGTPSIYSYGESLFAPSSISNVPPSMRVLRGKSEYSYKANGSRECISGENHNDISNYSDIESTTSIFNKPWVSSQVIPDPSSTAMPPSTVSHTRDHASPMRHHVESRPIENGLDKYKPNHYTASTGDRASSVPNMSTELTEPTKRRGSLGKLKAGIGRLLNGNRSSQQHYSSSRNNSVAT